MAALIDALGGGTVVALGINGLLPAGSKQIDRESVYKMKETNTCPHRWRPFIVRLARDNGVAVPPELDALARIVMDGAA